MRLYRFKLLVVIPFLCLLLDVPTFAAPPFEAVCEDTHSKAYRTHIYDDSYQQLTPDDSSVGWSEGEKFRGDPWTFHYDPSVNSQFILVDNNPSMVMNIYDHMLLVVRPNPGLVGDQGLMSYVIRTRLRKIVVTDVSGRQGDYNSVKGRVTTLKCKFHLPQEYLNEERLKEAERVLRQQRLQELMQDDPTVD